MVALDPVIEKPRLKKLGVSNKGISAILCLANVNPILSEEWHPTKNGTLTPWDVTVGMDTKVWWLGKDCKHSWEAAPKTRRKSGCSFCANKKVGIDNCLQTRKPKLASEWHLTKNGTLTPWNVTSNSHKKVWWTCSEGHSWSASITNRNSKKSNCPYCTNRKVCKDNCLQTRNPKLAKEWHPTKNGSLTTKDVVFSTNKKVWWKDKLGHEWQAHICDRNNGKAKCFICCSLQIKNPKLAKEWHPTKNGNLTAKDVFPNSRKKVWWKDKLGHEWQASLGNRAKGSGCPDCYKERNKK